MTLHDFSVIPFSEASPLDTARSRPAHYAIRTSALTLIVAVGILLVVLSYQEASPTNSGNFLLFWIGTGAIFLPLWLIAISKREDLRWGRVLATLLGAVAFIPKILRTPVRPLFHDELGHWESTVDLLRTGNPFASNSVVSIGRYYPGLHTLTAALVRLTSLPPWTLILVLLLLLHIVSLLGIYELSLKVWGRPSAAIISAMLYGISPSFAFIDGLFAYESLAVPLLIWFLVAAEKYAMSGTVSQRRFGWLFASLLLSAALAITHHLTALIGIGVLLLVATADLLQGPRRRIGRRLLGPLVALTVVTLGWTVSLRIPIYHYLSSYPTAAYHSIGPILDKLIGRGQPTAVGSSGGGGGVNRTLFGGSALPLYEQIAGFAAQPILALPFVALSVIVFRKHAYRSARGFGIVGSLYFLSLPLLFNSQSSAGAHRSWAVIYVGLAVFMGGTAVWLPGYIQRRSTRVRKTLKLGSVALLFVVLMGNYSTDNNILTTFPGPAVLEGDGRDTTSTAVVLAEWFASTQGRHLTIATDFSTATTFGAYADANEPDAYAYPFWKIFFPGELTTSSAQRLVKDAKIRYLVIDSRLASQEPFNGFYFTPFEAPSKPITRASLHTLETEPWLKPIRRFGTYEILKVVPYDLSSSTP